MPACLTVRPTTMPYRPLDLQTVLVNQPLPHHLQAVLRLGEACFPSDWITEGNERHFFRDALHDAANVNLFLTAGRRMVGYALAMPFTAAYRYLAPHDPELVDRPEFYYLETIQVHPRYRGRSGGQMLMQRIVNEVCRKGARGLAVHFRVLNGANLLPRRIPGLRVITARPIATWYWGGYEPYEYIEITLEDHGK